MSPAFMCAINSCCHNSADETTNGAVTDKERVAVNASSMMSLPRSLKVKRYQNVITASGDFTWVVERNDID